MILGLSLQTFTFLHVAISVLALVSGAFVVMGLLNSDPRPGWTAIFLITTILTSVTGFLFPIQALTPALVTGLISTPVLLMALFALYIRRLEGGWRWVYVVTAIAALYLNVVALIAQAFLKVSTLQALAPTGSEPPFLGAQIVALLVFILLGARAVRRFRPHLERVALT